RVEAGDFHATDHATVGQAVRAQVRDDRIALRQTGVRTEGEAVFTILNAHGGADLTRRQVEQTTLEGRFHERLLVQLGVLAVAVDVADALGRQGRDAERIEAATARTPS